MATDPELTRREGRERESNRRRGEGGTIPKRRTEVSRDKLPQQLALRANCRQASQTVTDGDGGQTCQIAPGKEK